MKSCPGWAIVSVIFNALLLGAIASTVLRQQYSAQSSPKPLPVVSMQLMAQMPNSKSNFGEKEQLSYQQWVALLGREAQVTAAKKPDNLVILLGDSISLWFPPSLLPSEQIWLNQGISGETTLGLLRRLELLDQTKPKAILVMIGINDLLKGTKDDTIVANQRLIVQHLKEAHPEAKIVIQSILPHGDKKATWEGRHKLQKIPNQRIQRINQRLRALAESESVIYLDLYPFFSDSEGNLRSDLSTDGLHLATSGYQVWSMALTIFSQLEINGEK